jgi:hypothetical protein
MKFNYGFGEDKMSNKKQNPYKKVCYITDIALGNGLLCNKEYENKLYLLEHINGANNP